MGLQVLLAPVLASMTQNCPRVVRRKTWSFAIATACGESFSSFHSHANLSGRTSLADRFARALSGPPCCATQPVWVRASGVAVRVGLGAMVGVRVKATVCVGLGTGTDVLVGKVVGVEPGAGRELGVGAEVLAQPARKTMLSNAHARLMKWILLCNKDCLILRRFRVPSRFARRARAGPGRRDPALSHSYPKHS